MKKLNTSDSSWTVIEPSQDYEISVLDVIDGTMYILTNLINCRRVSKGSESIEYLVIFFAGGETGRTYGGGKELIPEGEGVMSDVTFAGDKLIVTNETDAYNRSYVYSRDGNIETSVTV